MNEGKNLNSLQELHKKQHEINTAIEKERYGLTYAQRESLRTWTGIERMKRELADLEWRVNNMERAYESKFENWSTVLILFAVFFLGVAVGSFLL
jgi:predicted  nucleic acid-binding Zn-ribbon protein